MITTPPHNVANTVKSRENNFDLLRVICAFAVIVIHVSAQFVGAITSDPMYEGVYFDHILNDALYNGLSRFAVPCFVMLSGAFLLDNDRNADFSQFYRKSFKKLLIPVLVFSIIYFLYDYVLLIGKIFVLHKEVLSVAILLEPVKQLIAGAPFYHMWYMYMLIGLYALVPMVIRLKNEIGFDRFEKLAYIFLVVASLAGWVAARKINWDPGMSFRYLGYLMIGYVLRKRCYENNARACFFIVAGLLIETINSFLRYHQILQRIAEGDSVYNLYAPHAPLVVISSVLLFAGFAYLKTNISIPRLASASFVIYLVHAGILNCIQIISSPKFFALYDVTGDTRVIIPLVSVVTFLLSFVFAELYNILWSKFEKNTDISNRLCRLFWRN